MSFGSPSEEIAFWKNKAEENERLAKEAKEELEEFQEGSRELEQELEAQLEQAELKLKEFRSAQNRLQMDNDQIKDKLEQCQREYHCQVTELETELSEIKIIRDQLNKYVRDLEQQNDDLERAKRSTIASLEDFESRLNVAIERNAFLESELDEKESLQAAVQRMKDETRDLKSELRVLNPRLSTSGASRVKSLDSSASIELPDNDKVNNNDGGGSPLKRKSSNKSAADSNKLAADCETKSDCGSVLDTPPSSSKNSPSNRGGAVTNGGQPLTPSARISALNIVGDLLRKVGALELKLVSCRNIVKENGTSDSPTTTPSSDPGSVTPNAAATNGSAKGRLPRGTSTPTIKNSS